MKKNIFITSLITISLFCLTLMIACKKNKITDTSYGINAITNPDMVNKGLRLSGKLIKGGLPHSDGSGTGGVLIVSNPQAVDVSAGVDVYIPFSTNKDSQIVKLFVQVEGADSYWQIPAQDTNNTALYMKLFIPNFVQKGNFNLLFSVEDINGNVSPAAKTNTLVSNPLNCNSGASGSVGVTVKSFYLGDIPGKVTIDFDTYSIPDKIDVKFNHQWVASTREIPSSFYTPSCSDYAFGANAGFVSGTGSLCFDYTPTNQKKVDVYITGCNPGTAWDIQVNCPSSDTRKWYEKLPDCPCNYSEAQALDNTLTTCPSGTWSVCGTISTILGDFHHGATYEVRWLPTWSGASGQQCNYNSSGLLITGGIAAGSPDMVSPGVCFGIPNSGHYTNDVNTWKTKYCWEYLSEWPANQGNNCTNTKITISGIDHMYNMVKNMTCEEVTLLISQAETDPSIELDLRDFIIGKPSSLSDAQLKTKLLSWKNTITCTLNPTLCKVIDKAIARL